MMLHEVTKHAGAHRRRKRVGRGESSGHGKTCTRGNKGSQARAGGLVRPLTEGGQMPLFRRLPKRGFSNFHFETKFDVVNLQDLERVFQSGETVDREALRRTRLARGSGGFVKVLAKGALTKKLTVEVHAVSAKAREAIEKVGGTIKLIARPDRAELAARKRNTVRKSAAKPASVKRSAGPTASGPSDPAATTS